MQQYWIVVCITAAIITSSGYAQDLLITVTPKQSNFGATDDVQVIVNYKNVDNDTLLLHEWLWPKKTLIDPLFKITRDGYHVTYTGPLLKRLSSRSADAFSLAPGQDVSILMQVSSVYDMTQSGNYTIQFHMHAARVFVKWTHSSARTGHSTLTSAPAVFFAVGRPNSLIDHSGPSRRVVRQAVTTYPNCSDNQTSAVQNAVVAAKSYAVRAQFYLKKRDPSATARFTNWFGNFSSNDVWDNITSHFSNIQDTIANQNLTFQCNCPLGSSNTVAYVYASLPYTIYLCNGFMQSAYTGTDSMGGAIIHELSHFSIVVGTADNAYGQTACAALALSNSGNARNNADSHEYFAENEPPLQ